MKYLILTAKHHGGLPVAHCYYTVRREEQPLAPACGSGREGPTIQEGFSRARSST